MELALALYRNEDGECFVAQQTETGLKARDEGAAVAPSDHYEEWSKALSFEAMLDALKAYSDA